MDPLLVLLFICLFALSAFFSWSELALMSLSIHKIDSYIKEWRIWAASLKKVRKEFFDNITISEETYIPKPSFEEFSELAINILIDSKLNFAGIPKGNKEKTTTYTYSKEDGPINAILFYLLTNFSKNFDQKVFSNIIKSSPIKNKS